MKRINISSFKSSPIHVPCAPASGTVDDTNNVITIIPSSIHCNGGEGTGTGTTYVDSDTIDFNETTAHVKDDAITDAKLATDVKVGSLASLLTTAKNNVVAAINELREQVVNKISNITGLVTQGSNITVTGNGTAASPYVINGPEVAGDPNSHVQNTDLGTTSNTWQIGRANTGDTATISAVSTADTVNIALEPKGTGFLKSSRWTGAVDRMTLLKPDGTLQPGRPESDYVTSVSMGAIGFVSPFGDDATAIPGRFDKPYRLIQTALDDVNVKGIMLFPTIYTEAIDVGAYLSGADPTSGARLCTVIFMNGATITSDDPNATLIIGKGGFRMVGEGVVENTGTGAAFRSGPNPGLFTIELNYIKFRSVMLGMSTTSTRVIMNSCDVTVTGANSRAFFGHEYGHGIDFVGYNCNISAPNGYIVKHEADEYSPTEGYWSNCTFYSLKGFWSNWFAPYKFRNCRIDVTGTEWVFTNGKYNKTDSAIYFENTIVVCQGDMFRPEYQENTVAHIAATNSQFISLGGNSMNIKTQGDTTNYEFRECKFVSAATYSMTNDNATGTQVNLINCVANKDFGPNLNGGILHNNLINPNLKYFPNF